jgi:hypothetical protein
MPFTFHDLRGWFYIFTSLPLVHTSTRTFRSSIFDLTSLRSSNFRPRLPNFGDPYLCFRRSETLEPYWSLTPGLRMLLTVWPRVHDSRSSQVLDSRSSQVHDSGSSRVHDSRRSQVHDSGSLQVHDLREIDSRFTWRSQKWLLFSHITPKTYLTNFVKPDVPWV